VARIFYGDFFTHCYGELYVILTSSGGSKVNGWDIKDTIWPKSSQAMKCSCRQNHVTYTC